MVDLPPAASHAPQVFLLRAFPRRLMGSMAAFAGAGTLMAAVVYHDGLGGIWVPAFIALCCWLIPAVFAWQVHTQGFDPLQQLEITDAGLLAHYRDGRSRLMPWKGLQRLIRVEGFRNRAWALVHTEQPPLIWFGELEEPELLADAVSSGAGLPWETLGALPDIPG